MAIVRRNGGLFDDKTSLKDRVNQIGTETPTTPAAAQTLTGNPDVAKMAGTPAQKKPVLEQRVAKEETLAGSQRLDQPRQQATTAEQSAQQKAQQLRQLGSLNNRVQSLIEQRLQQAGAAATGQAVVETDRLAAVLGVTKDQAAQLAQDPTSNYAIAQAALAEYAANPTGPSAEAALVKLTNAGIAPQTAQQLINTSATGTAKQFANNVSDQVTVADLDPTQLGYGSAEELASVLGVDPAALPGMTIQQLQQQVETARQAELSRVQNLRAQLASTPVGSARYQQLTRELGDLSQSGVTGTERVAAETAEQINTADQVEVGGQTVSVEDLLKDETLSSLITEYLSSDPETRERLLPAAKFGDLRSWIDDNQAALADLANTMTGTASAFGETQQAWKDLTQLNDDLALDDEVLAKLTGWDANKAVTSADLAAVQQQLANSGVGQLAQDPANAAIIQKLSKDNVDQIKNLTAEEIKTADSYAQLANDPIYAELLGLTGQRDFVTDPNLQSDIDELKPVIDLMREKGVAEEWLRDPEFKELNPQRMMALAEDPAQFKEFQRYNKVQEQISNAETIDDALSIILGHDVSAAEMADLQKELADVRAYAKLGAPGAADRLKRFEALLDANRDGSLDDKDFSTLMEKLKKGIPGDAAADVVGGKDFRDLAGGLVDDKFASTPYAPKDKPFFDTVRSALKDGQFTTQEFDRLSRADQERVMKLSAGKNWGPGIPKDYNSYVKDKTTQAGIQTIKNISGYDLRTLKNRLTGYDNSFMGAGYTVTPEYIEKAKAAYGEILNRLGQAKKYTPEWDAYVGLSMELQKAIKTGESYLAKKNAKSSGGSGKIDSSMNIGPLDFKMSTNS